MRPTADSMAEEGLMRAGDQVPYTRKNLEILSPAKQCTLLSLASPPYANSTTHGCPFREELR